MEGCCFFTLSCFDTRNSFFRGSQHFPCETSRSNAEWLFPSLFLRTIPAKNVLFLHSLSYSTFRGTACIMLHVPFSSRKSFLWGGTATFMPYASLFNDTCSHSVCWEKDYLHSREGNHREFTGISGSQDAMLYWKRFIEHLVKHLTPCIVKMCRIIQPTCSLFWIFHLSAAVPDLSKTKWKGIL